MATAMTSMSQVLLDSTKVFPKQVTENYTSSVNYMKQLTVVAISTITFLKNAFPDDSYSLEHFGGLKLRILKKNCTNDLANFLSTALTQAFDAFDKKYLQQLALCFYEGECSTDNLVEYHIFEYTYNKDMVTMNVRSKSRDSAPRTNKYTLENIRESTVHLIRACVVLMQTSNQSLPPDYDVSLRLYYNQDAPEDYQAPGYVAEGEDHLEASSTLGEVIQLGCVKTPFHSLTASSFFKDNLRASHEAIPSPNPPMMSQTQYEELANTNVPPLRCPCNNYDGLDVRDTPLITCMYCNTQQHAVCFGLVGENLGQSHQHCCCDCADDDATRNSTDPGLTPLSIVKRECTCMFRRALSWCSILMAKEEIITGSQLAAQLGLRPQFATKLVKRFAIFGIIQQQPSYTMATPLKINEEQLNSTMEKFFHNSPIRIVDRLLAETFGSQESQPDPVGEVLGPMEKVSLQNASKLGRVIDNPGLKPTATEDSTLLQYKEALISNYEREEELPLSGSHNPIKDMDSLGKTSYKRKLDDKEDKSKRRSGVRTKKAKNRV